MANSKYKIKTVVLRPILDLSEAEQIVENGKTSLFRSMLQKPKKMEEHVYLDDEQEVAFDHHGKEIKMPYKMSSRLIESYPRRTLEKTKNNVKKPEITYDAAVLRLTSKLKKSVSIGRRNLEEKITINEIIELYVPIYEARLIGPKKNVRLMRIDSIRKKVL